jgi:hypothetical protein
MALRYGTDNIEVIDLFEKEAIRVRSIFSKRLSLANRTKIEKEAENTPNSGKVEFFLQGTLYPDV